MNNEEARYFNRIEREWEQQERRENEAIDNEIEERQSEIHYWCDSE